MTTDSRDRQDKERGIKAVYPPDPRTDIVARDYPEAKPIQIEIVDSYEDLLDALDGKPVTKPGWWPPTQPKGDV